MSKEAREKLENLAHAILDVSSLMTENDIKVGGVCLEYLALDLVETIQGIDLTEKGKLK